MLDIKFIRENSEYLKTICEQKRFNADIDQLLEVDSELKAKQTQLETLQSERNNLSKQIGKVSPEEREPLKTKVAALKPEMESLTEVVISLKEKFGALMLAVPAPQREDVPIGKSDEDNVVIKHWGEKPVFDFKTKDHAELGHKLGILDIPRGVKISGSRSYVLVGDGARLEQALLRYTYDKLCQRGFQPMSVPVLVKEHTMVGTGYFPGGRDQAYCVPSDEMALVGTSEVPMASYYSDEMLKEEQLPIKFAAQSTCFRREAGTYGKDTHGLYRVHQFQKVEQVILGKADPEDSEKLHMELLENAESVMQDLGLHYRVVYVCSGDLGQGQIRKHDIETWMPSRNSYGETHSCSTFHDFQSRRLKIRYKDKDGKKKFCYSLNNTAVATPRALIPLLECYQTAEGRIRVPECLRPYMGGQEII